MTSTFGELTAATVPPPISLYVKKITDRGERIWDLNYFMIFFYGDIRRFSILSFFFFIFFVLERNIDHLVDVIDTISMDIIFFLI